MKRGLSLLLVWACCTIDQSIFLRSASAQIIPDDTTNTTVKINGNNSSINGGDRAGSNLFHSFSDFSIPNDGAAFFNNAAEIVNIFSRVTGGNISNINGLLGANGTANLFLINPAGIRFGPDAKLDLGGSFYGSTADSILFPDGEFRATDLDNPPLITINAPIGLNFRDNPGAIVNKSFVQNSTGAIVGLEVASGANLTLVGGDLNFEAGKATAKGGNIELGGLSAAGTVDINNDGSLGFRDHAAKADINLSQAAEVDVRGTGDGSITINTRNLSLEAMSTIRAGITAEATASETQAGDITINATENITVDDSSIINLVGADAVGNSGGIIIRTGSITLTNGGKVNVNSFGQGNTGDINITATDTITIDGETSAAITSNISSQGDVGNGGNITISTDNLTLTNGGEINASTLGTGNGGSVTITAKDTITIDNQSAAGITSLDLSTVSSGTEGNAGDITINAGSLTLTNGEQVDAGTLGQGNAGNITLDTNFIITFPNQNHDVITNAKLGSGGNIIITTRSLFDIEERPLNGTNINNSLIPAFIIPADTKIPMNPIESEQTFALVCYGYQTNKQPSGLLLKEKDGMPSFSAEPDPEIKPIQTSMGDIYPARGIIKTKDGRIILTAYPTENINTRTPHLAVDCN